MFPLSVTLTVLLLLETRRSASATRVIDSIRAVLSGYGIRPDEVDHAIRMLRCTIHGFAAPGRQRLSVGNDPDESVASDDPIRRRWADRSRRQRP